jgi:two-component SAPR family response regulator
VFISGNSDLALGRDRELNAGVFVPKPFTAEELNRAVARVVQEGRAGPTVEPLGGEAPGKRRNAKNGWTGRPKLSLVRNTVRGDPPQD